MAGKVITDFIKLQMYRKGGAIATDKAVQFAANALEKRLINLGIDPSTLNSQTQLKQILAYVKQAEDAAFNQMNVLSGKDAENALKRFMGQDTSADVFDLTGKKIDTSQGIMGGKSVKDLMESGEVTKGTVTKQSDKVKDREMFKEANERFKKNETEAEILERLNRENKENVQKIKNRKMLEESIDNVSPGFASGDTKYNAQLVADDLAQKMYGVDFYDLDQRKQIDLYDQAYTGLTKKRFDPPEDLAQGGRAGYSLGSMVSQARQQSNGIESRLEQLGTDVTSAEQMLQQINQRIQSAGSSIPEGGIGGLQAVQPGEASLMNVSSVTRPSTIDLKDKFKVGDVFSTIKPSNAQPLPPQANLPDRLIPIDPYKGTILSGLSQDGQRFDSAQSAFDALAEQTRKTRETHRGRDVIGTELFQGAEGFKNFTDMFNKINDPSYVAPSPQLLASSQENLQRALPGLFAQGGRAGLYTGGMVDVEPNLSDIGHGSDALMARTRLISPGAQGTTSTGLNYLLAEDNDNIRVPFQDGLSAAKKYGNIFVEDENIIDKGGNILEEKLSEFIPTETKKEKEEREMFEMVKEFQTFKRFNPNSLMSFGMFREKKKKEKEKELYKNKVLELAVKYPDKKIITKDGFVDKKELKEAIDQAEADLEISPVDGLILKRSVNTEGEQSATSGSFNINNFSFTSPSIEEGKLTSSANFDIGNLNLSGALDTKDSNVLQSNIGFNYDDVLKGKFSESDGFKTGELNLNKTIPINDKFNLNFTGGANTMITPDGEKYTSSELTPKLSYDDGIFNVGVAKEIMEGGNEPNLSAGVNYNDFYLRGDNLLSDDKSGILGYQKEFGNPNDKFYFTLGAEKNLFDDDYTAGAGLKYKFADGGRTGFSVGGSGRRAFLKLIAALTGGVAAAKSGILGLVSKDAPTQVTKEVVKQAAPDVPPYFFKLVDKIKTLGDDTMATQDNTIAKKYKDYVMEEDFAGNITIIKKDMDNPYPTEVIMSYKVDDVALPGGKGITKVDEYEEFTARPDFDGKMKDVEGGVPDEVIEEAMEDTIKLKAEGGRIGFSGGKSLAKLLADKTITGSSRRFLEKVFGKESFENMIENDPELYRGLLETVEMFRKRDKEGLKMYMQKFLPHMDDEAIEDLIIGSEGTEGIQGQLLRLGSGRDYKGKLDMIREADQNRKLRDLEVTEEMIRKPNALGGRIGFSGGGIFRAIIAKAAAAKGMKPYEFIKVTSYKSLPREVKMFMSQEDFAKLKFGQEQMYNNYIDMMKTRKNFQEQVEAGKQTPASPIFEYMEKMMDEKSFVPKTVTADDIAEAELMVKNRFQKGRKDNAQGGLAKLLGE